MVELALVVATVYADLGPTYCAQHTSSIVGPWVALPAETHGTDWQCGDLVYLRFYDGSTLMARALDAGPFLHHCVETADGCLPIVADVPARWWQHGRDTSARLVYWQNVSAKAREAGEW